MRVVRGGRSSLLPLLAPIRLLFKAQLQNTNTGVALCPHPCPSLRFFFSQIPPFLLGSSFNPVQPAPGHCFLRAKLSSPRAQGPSSWQVEAPRGPQRQPLSVAPTLPAGVDTARQHLHLLGDQNTVCNFGFQKHKFSKYSHVTKFQFAAHFLFFFIFCFGAKFFLLVNELGWCEVHEL